MTRGFRNNNPGNLRAGVAWVGCTGADADGYAQFDSMVHGVRALGRDLLTKLRERRPCVESIIRKYAPGSENPTSEYIAFVCEWLSVSPTDLLDERYLLSLAEAIVHFENGADLPSVVMDEGIEQAFTTIAS